MTEGSTPPPCGRVIQNKHTTEVSTCLTYRVSAHTDRGGGEKEKEEEEEEEGEEEEEEEEDEDGDGDEEDEEEEEEEEEEEIQRRSSACSQ